MTGERKGTGGGKTRIRKKNPGRGGQAPATKEACCKLGGGWGGRCDNHKKTKKPKRGKKT